MWVDKEAIPYIVFFTCFAAFCFFMGSHRLAATLLIIGFCIGAFFRDPERKLPEGSNLIVSPADGTIVEIEQKETFPLAEGKTFTRISIFLSVLNVHINRAPVAGQLTAYAYHPGKFMIASHPKASLDNEQSHLLFVTDKKVQVGMKQIAGWIARRIVTRVHKDDMVSQGQRIGLIRFGSRVDVFIPSTAKLLIKKGDKVSGITSILATL